MRATIVPSKTMMPKWTLASLPEEGVATGVLDIVGVDCTGVDCTGGL